MKERNVRKGAHSTQDDVKTLEDEVFEEFSAVLKNLDAIVKYLHRHYVANKDKGGRLLAEINSGNVSRKQHVTALRLNRLSNALCNLYLDAGGAFSAILSELPEFEQKQILQELDIEETTQEKEAD